MTEIFVPTSGPDDWRRLLAEPEKHWKTGNSAKALAHCWEAAGGLPAEVAAVLGKSPALSHLEALICIPEHQVPLPGGSRPSQNDVWVLGRTPSGLVSIAVEGKVSESFGPTVGEWYRDHSTGKEKRLAFLCEQLEIDFPPAAALRYQLLHRAVSAVIEAHRYHAQDAVMLVHSFSPVDERFDDYAEFANVLDLHPAINEVASRQLSTGTRLHLAWVHGGGEWLRA